MAKPPKDGGKKVGWGGCWGLPNPREQPSSCFIPGLLGLCRGCNDDRVPQVTSDLPEHRHMRGVVGSYSNDCDTTIDERTRGVGGLLTRYGAPPSA